MRLYLGIDIGGTKIQASLAEESGAIIAREKTATPREGGPEQVVATLEKVIDKVLKQANTVPDALTGIGVAVPGVADPKTGRVIVTPNMNLTGVASAPTWKTTSACRSPWAMTVISAPWAKPGSARDAGPAASWRSWSAQASAPASCAKGSCGAGPGKRPAKWATSSCNSAARMRLRQLRLL